MDNVDISETEVKKCHQCGKITRCFKDWVRDPYYERLYGEDWDYPEYFDDPSVWCLDCYDRRAKE